jgi:DNA repair exonuclease SbcCD ATPase subunit
MAIEGEKPAPKPIASAKENNNNNEEGGWSKALSALSKPVEAARGILVILDEVKRLDKMIETHEDQLGEIEDDLKQAFEDLARLYEKQAGLVEQQQQFIEHQGKLLEQYGKRIEELSTQLGNRIDDTNARFNGFDKQTEYMVKVILAEERKKPEP